MGFPKTIYWMQRTLLPAHDVGGVSGPSKRQEIEKCRWPDAWHECVWLQDPLAYTIWNAVLLLLVAKRKLWGGQRTAAVRVPSRVHAFMCTSVGQDEVVCCGHAWAHWLQCAGRWPLVRMRVELLIGFQMVGHPWLLRGGNCCDSRLLLQTTRYPLVFSHHSPFRPHPSISRPRATLLQTQCIGQAHTPSLRPSTTRAYTLLPHPGPVAAPLPLVTFLAALPLTSFPSTTTTPADTSSSCPTTTGRESAISSPRERRRRRCRPTLRQQARPPPPPSCPCSARPTLQRPRVPTRTLMSTTMS